MVLGILTAIAACPAIVGTTEAIRQGQKQAEREKHRGRKSSLVVTLPVPNTYSQSFDGSFVVLENQKLYVDVSGASQQSHPPAHPFAGYYLPYPGTETRWKSDGFRGEGFVSTISDDPPMLNWIYVDRNTHEVKYGVRGEAESHLVGPWDVTSVDRRVTFEGWEGFVAVQEDEESKRDMWALYFDRDDDSLVRIGIGGKGLRMLAVELWRKERRMTKAAAEDERQEDLRKQREMREERHKGVPVHDNNPTSEENTMKNSYEEEIDE